MRAINTITRSFSPLATLAIAATLLAPAKRASAEDPKPAEQLVSIEGKVIAENGDAVSEVSVYLYLDQSKAGQTRTDADGRYSFQVPFKGPWITLVADDPAQDRQGYAHPSANLRGAAPTSIDNITLKPARHIVVKVIDSHGNPIAGATVAAPDSFRALGETFFMRTTDQNGIVQLRYLDEAMIHQIVAFKPQVGLDYYALPLASRGTQPDAPGWGQDAKLGQHLRDTVILRLTGARRLEIKSIDSAGQGVSGADFYPAVITMDGKEASLNMMRGSSLLKTTTDAFGKVVYDYLPNEFKAIAFVASPPAPYVVGDDGRERLTLDGSAPLSQVTIPLVRMVRITGHVYLPDGAPAKSVALDVVSEGRFRPLFGRRRLVAQADGSYVIVQIPFKEQFVVGVIDDHLAAPDQIIHPRPDADIVENVDFHLTDRTVIHGKVTEEPDHRPIAGEFVEIVSDADELPAGESYPSRIPFQPSATSFWRSTFTDADGNYRLCVPPGNYKLAIGIRHFDLTVTDQHEIARDVEFPHMKMAKLSGRVVDPNGQPLANMTVLLGSAEHLIHDMRDLSTTTDANGEFKIERPAAAVVLMVRGERGSKSEGGAIIPADQETVEILFGPYVEARGRVVDESGKPVATGYIDCGLETAAGYQAYTFGGRSLLADGTYILPGVIPGMEISVYYYRKAPFEDRTRRSIRLKTFTAQPGKDLDLGDTKIPKDKPSQTPAQ